uniref:ZP domain-containing protein n=1 Tax=Anopheles maculatus TaxID=74869 RepID=A0A182S9H7_9DIPT
MYVSDGQHIIEPTNFPAVPVFLCVLYSPARSCSHRCIEWQYRMERLLIGEGVRQKNESVTDIQCSFASQGSNLGDIITAKLKKPIGFKGAPLFADDRGVNPETDFACSIKQDRKDVSELAYDLKITDFSRCGVLKRNVSFYDLGELLVRDFCFFGR